MARINDMFNHNPLEPFNQNMTSAQLLPKSFEYTEATVDFLLPKSTEDAIDDENESYDKIKFHIDDKNCEICKSTLEDGCYVLCKNNEKHYFCSSKCLSQFKSQNSDVNKYDLYEVSRCASYKCCLELGNLRRLCERTERKNTNYIADLSVRRNFCEPAQAGQIQASYAIYKYLNKVQSENEKMSVENTKLNRRSQRLTFISTIMAGITIILTIINIPQSCNNKTVDIMKEMKINQETLIETVNAGNEDMNLFIEKTKNDYLKIAESQINEQEKNTKEQDNENISEN